MPIEWNLPKSAAHFRRQVAFPIWMNFELTVQDAAAIIYKFRTSLRQSIGYHPMETHTNL